MLPEILVILNTIIHTEFFFSQDDLNNLLYGLASRYYGISNLQEFQKEAAKAAIFGKDCIVVQPTGSGKSICYQLIALLSKKLAIVFTPTVALMYDQVQQLRSRGITAVVLDSDYIFLHLAMEHDNSNEAVVVFLTAEHIFGPLEECKKQLKKLEELVENGRVSVIALDEAHLLFQWSHFRYFCQNVHIDLCTYSIFLQTKLQYTQRHQKAVSQYFLNVVDSNCSPQ